MIHVRLKITFKLFLKNYLFLCINLFIVNTLAFKMSDLVLDVLILQCCAYSKLWRQSL